jgi:hypothetical protein
MRLRTLLQRLLTSALAISQAWLLVSLALPHAHSHDSSSLAHTAQACRVCKLQEQGAGAVTPTQSFHATPTLVVVRLVAPDLAPRAVHVWTPTPSRAPPHRSV